MSVPTQQEIDAFIHVAGEGDVLGTLTLLETKIKKQVDAKDTAGNTALINAAFRGHRKVVAMLLDRGARINDHNNDGNTALMAAAWHNHQDVVQLLLERGAAYNKVNHSGFNELDLATRHGCEEAAGLLMAIKASAGQPDA